MSTLVDKSIQSPSGEIVQKAIQMEHELLARGIPEEEVHRAVIAYFSQAEPPDALQWPGPVTGLDLAGRVDPYIVPDTTGVPLTDFRGLPKDVQPYPTPNKPPYPMGGVNQYQSNPTPDPNSLGNLSNTYNVLNPPYPYESTVWNGLASDVNSEPSMHNEYGYNVATTIPTFPDSYEALHDDSKIHSRVIEPSGAYHETIDPKELQAGIEIELEHTDDYTIARQIAIDHLNEDPKYYTKLLTHVEPEKKHLLESNTITEAKKESQRKKLLENLAKWAALLGGVAGMNAIVKKYLDSDMDKPLEIIAEYQYHGHDNDDECAKYSGKRFNLLETHTRPVIPSEKLGYTTTHPNCYSDDTEIYTDQGWKLFKDLDKSENMLSINPKTYDLEFVKPIQYIVYHHKGKIIEFKNKWNNLCVTEDHNMVLSNHGTKHLYFRKACELNNNHQIYRTSKWKGNDVQTVKINDLEINAKTFCAFMGYWLSEGSLSKRSKNSYQISITQHKQEQMQKIFKDISFLPLKVDRGQSALYIFNSSLGEYLQQFGKSFEKFVPNVIKEMSPNLIQVFLDAYLLGDGHIRKSRTKMGIRFNEERSYFTSSKRLIDDIGELILKIGKVPSFTFESRKGKFVKFKNGIYETKTDMWIVRETRSKTSTIKRMIKNRIDYNGMVYCVELPKYHTLYVRRNGQCSWCGNCVCTWGVKPDSNLSVNKVTKNEQEEINSIENHITQAAKKGKLHTIKKDGKLSKKTTKKNPLKELCSCMNVTIPSMHLDLSVSQRAKTNKTKGLPRKALQEAVANLRNEFAWLTDDYIDSARKLAEEADGQLYLVRAASESITDHRGEGEQYRRKLSSDELNSMTRTAIGKSMDINHQAEFETDATILDAEFDKKRKEIQMLVVERDPEINKAINDRKITAVSINGGMPRSETIEPCNHGCESNNCELCLVPKGVVLGEIDNIGMTWVVSDPNGLYWNGHFVPSAEPGIKVTKIESL